MPEIAHREHSCCNGNGCNLSSAAKVYKKGSCGSETHSHPSTAMGLFILVVLALSAAMATEDEASPRVEISMRLFQEADANSDGQLSLQEFLSIGEETTSGNRQGRTFPSGLLLRSKDSAR